MRQMINEVSWVNLSFVQAGTIVIKYNVIRGGSTKYTHLITESALALITESALFVLPIKQNMHIYTNIKHKLSGRGDGIRHPLPPFGTPLWVCCNFDCCTLILLLPLSVAWLHTLYGSNPSNNKSVCGNKVTNSWSCQWLVLWAVCKKPNTCQRKINAQ